MQLSTTKGWAAAVEQFKRAVEIDDGFAVAHARLGVEYSVHGESVLGIKHTTRAFELRERAADDEKFLITATYHRQVTGNLPLALQAFDLWEQTYPRTFNYQRLASGFVIKGQGRYEQCVQRAGKAEAADPRAPFGYVNAAACYVYLDRFDEAARSLQRAADRQVSLPDVATWQFHLAFFRGDDAAMEGAIGRARGQSPEADVTHLKALVLARSGRLQLAGSLERRAIELAQSAGQSERAALFRAASAVWQALVGNVAEARRAAAAALDLSTGRLTPTRRC